MIIEYNSAVEFLEKLDPVKTDSSLYFRGQPNDKYSLLPSVWRYGIDKNLDRLFESFKRQVADKITLVKPKLEESIQRGKSKYQTIYKDSDCQIPDNFLEKALTYITQVKFENYLLCNFYNLANASGLKVPAILLQRAQNDHSNNLLNEKFDMGVNDDFFCGFFTYLARNHLTRHSVLYYHDPSLPQHAGLPTRLLDWSTNPRKAAFFAAFYSLSIKSDKIAVYSIKTRNMPMGPLQLINNHHRYENQFLHAQDGLFTTIYGDFFYLKHGRWPSIENLIEEHGNDFFELEKFILPSSHVPELLERLSRCGISISTLMPGYPSIAEQIKTLQFYSS